jgi:hypothetical protein
MGPRPSRFNSGTRSIYCAWNKSIANYHTTLTLDGDGSCSMQFPKPLFHSPGVGAGHLHVQFNGFFVLPSMHLPQNSQLALVYASHT